MTKEFQKIIFRRWSERNDFFSLNLDIRNQLDFNQ